MSKRDKLYEAAAALDALQCPVCGAPLAQDGADFACAGGHRVNVNRKGCLNFLSAPVDTCYDAALFAARERVFRTGCYRPVAEALARCLPDARQRVLDAGCGEGWYLNALLSAHPNWRGAGIDISRDAILRATDQPCTALWCVADLRRLPFRSGAFTAVLDVLTPASYGEFCRVLAPNGLLVKVYPRRDYLVELREARGMARYEEGQVERYLRERMTVVSSERVTAVCPVTPALWRDFVWMTPLNQDLSAAEKDALSAAPRGTVTIDLQVDAVRPIR